MTRELKFRIWNTALKKYVCPNVVEQKDGLWLNLGNEDNIYEFEQYTGLKDKNGKEIYEGDIIEDTFTDIFDNEYKEIWEVFWDEELLSYQIRNKKSSDTCCLGGCVDSELEVIGNTHENPELLGGDEE